MKFSVKDFRTDSMPANCDLKKQGMIERSASPIKQRHKQMKDDDDSDEFAEEEAVEIDCGVVSTHMPDGSEI